MICSSEIALILMLSAAMLHGAEPDSVAKKFPEVEVTAGRLSQSPISSVSAETLISREEVDETGSRQLSGAIRSAPGVFIKDYGGLGGLKTISMRGATAQQTLILLDGMKLNNTQNGMVDLSSFPLSIASGFEIMRGGGSAAYGGNALGGIVNIVTGIQEGLGANARLRFGSFGEKFGSLAAHYSIEKIRIAIGAEYLESDGDYEFETEQFGETENYKRKNADFRNLALTSAIQGDFSGWQTKARLILRDTDRGTPGAVIRGNVESSDGRLGEHEAILVASVNRQFSESINLDAGLLARFNEQSYMDSYLPDAAFDSEKSYINRDIKAKIDFNSEFFSVKYSAGLEGGFADLRGDMLDPSVERQVERTLAALSFRAEKLLLRYEHSEISALAAIRADYYSDAGSALSPLLGLSWISLDDALEPHLNWSYNFRPPGFNEMYYLNYGTADLKPERSHSVNAGISWEPISALKASADAFILNTKNRIIAVPKGINAWSAQNLGEAFSRGAEFSLKSEFTIKDLEIKGRLAYTRQLVTDETAGSATEGKQIIYIPEEIISGFVSAGFANALIGAAADYSSFRYSRADNTYDSVLPSYFVLNVFAEYHFSIFRTDLVLRADFRNISNERYEIIRNFPMPGRSFSISLSISI